MIKYKRIFKQNGILRYEFYPEGDCSNPGVVEFEEGKEPRLVRQSALDVKMYYASHALNGIDLAKESGCIAWY